MLFVLMVVVVTATVLVVRQGEASQHPSPESSTSPGARTSEAGALTEEEEEVVSAVVETNSTCHDAGWCLRQRLRDPLNCWDARLIKHLQEMIEPPPQLPNRLRPQQPPWQHRPSFNITENYIRAFTQGQEGGVFVEVGAQDGLWLSNTWSLEATQGWRGLLVEADPVNYRLLRASPRASRTLPVCVIADPFVSTKQLVRTRSPSNFTNSLLSAQQGRSKLVKYATSADLYAGDTWTTTCYPVFSVLAAAGYSEIDLLTFDLSGGGLEMAAEFLALNKEFGNHFHVKLLLYQDSLMEQFFDVDGVEETFLGLGYNTLKIRPAHYLLYHKSINVVFS